LACRRCISEEPVKQTPLVLEKREIRSRDTSVDTNIEILQYNKGAKVENIVAEQFYEREKAKLEKGKKIRD
jgi:hypothetical protein